MSPEHILLPHSEMPSMRRWRSRSSQGVKASQTWSVGMCRAQQQLAVGMQRMGGRTNIGRWIGCFGSDSSLNSPNSKLVLRAFSAKRSAGLQPPLLRRFPTAVRMLVSCHT